MAATESRMLPLGTEAPAFSLPDPDGNVHTLDETSDARAFLVMFICNHCPFVKHVAPELARLGDDYAGQAQRPSIGCGIKWRPGNAPA